MQPEIKSITIYIRQEQLDEFVRGENYNSLVWTLTPGDFFFFKQVQVQISLDTYYQLVDAQNSNQHTDVDMDAQSYFDPNQLEYPF